MSIGTSILNIRKSKGMSQEEFGQFFYVTRQTVSNWENEKSYPDLSILVKMSDTFLISLDELIKGDRQMIQTIDKERRFGNYKKKVQFIGRLTAVGTGMIISCIGSPDSIRRNFVFSVSLILILIGWYQRSRLDKELEAYFSEQEFLE